MKRRTLKSIACAAVMALALSVTACGGSDDAAKTNEDTNVEENAENTEDAGQDTEAEAETETETEDTTGADAAADTETEAEPEADASADGAEGTYATLEDYYNDPSVKSVLDASFDSMSQEGMALSVEAKGNVLTMTCKFEDSSVVVDGLGDTLSAGLDASAAQFEQIAASFDEAVGGAAGTCTFAVRYTDPDDNVLAEKEFKAQ